MAVLTLSEAAARAKVSERTIFAWIKAKKLAAVRIADNVRIEKNELERYLEERSKVMAY